MKAFLTALGTEKRGLVDGANHQLVVWLICLFSTTPCLCAEGKAAGKRRC